MPGGTRHRLHGRRCVGVLLLAAGLLVREPPAQAQEPILAAVAATLDLALDQGDGRRVLALLADATEASPALAADLAAMGTHLAPWLAADVAASVVAAVPAEGRDAMASQVLAAVLTAGQGRLGQQILAAVGRAAPQADPDTLESLARFLSVEGAMAADGDLVLGDLTADGVPAPVLDAVRRARQADLDGRQVISRLPPRGRPGSAGQVGRAIPDLARPAELDNVQPRLTEFPRLPDPGQIASPS